MGQKKEVYHVQPLTEGKKNIIAALMDEYDIQNTNHGLRLQHYDKV